MGEYVLNVAKRLASNTEGATSIEYALIAALIGLAIISSAQTLGQNVSKPLVIASDNLTK